MSKGSSGFFITFEGLDGSGKTTQLKRLAGWLESAGHTVVSTRQPGSTPLGDRIRALLLDSTAESQMGGIAPMAELALMFADRAQSIAQVIQPALDEGKIVLCDRYSDSTEAYQGGGRELGSEVVIQAHQTLCRGLQPDLTLLLLPDLAASLVRARRRNDRATRQHGTDENRFEREGDAFYTRVHQKYLEIAAREPLRVVTIEGDGSIDAIHDRICTIVGEQLMTRAAKS